MLAKRIITCLDVKEGRTVKGVHFNDLKDAGDIVELAKKYSVAGADELVFLDITASNDNRSTRLSWVERVATAVDVILGNNVLLWLSMPDMKRKNGAYTVKEED